jgi:hypothetical protein
MVAIYVPLIPLFLFARRQLMGKPAKKKSRANESSVTFRDVAGVDKAKQELMEVRQQLWLDEPVTAGTEEFGSQVGPRFCTLAFVRGRIPPSRPRNLVRSGGGTALG